MKSSKRTKQVLWSAVMAVGVGGVAGHAWGQITYPFNANFASEVETTGPYTSAGTGPSYIDVNGAGEHYTNYSVLQFSTAGGQFPNILATAVSDNFTLDLTDNDYSGETTEPTTLNYFLVDDATTDATVDGNSPLIYEPTGALGGGLATPGSTGGFPAGDHIYYLGSQAWSGAGTGALNAVSLSLDNATMNATGAQNVSAANSYLLGQVTQSLPVRILVTSSNTDSTYVAYDGWASASVPQLNLTVTSTPPTTNTSAISLTSPPAGATSNHIPSINLGRVVESYASFTSTLTVGNSVGASGGALVLASPNYGLDGSTAPSAAIPAGGTATVTVGFSSGDTSGYAAGYDATGSLTFTDANNTASIISVASAIVLVVDQRVITAGGTGKSPSPAAVNIGKVLVNTTVSDPNVTLATTNSNTNLPAGQYGPTYLTTETLAAGAQSQAYSVKDPFSAASVATISATANNAYIFQNGTADTNGVTGSVTPTISGIYGDNHQEVIGTTTGSFTGNYTAFTGSYGMTNDGTTAGESDYADVYLQWQGYQAAAVTPSAGPTNVGSAVSLTNAGSTDNIYMGVNNGLRANAWVTGSVGSNQTWTGGPGWTLTGLTGDTLPLGPTTNGTVITAGGSSVSATVNFTPTNQMISGTYGATLAVHLENEQDIQGSASNDLADVLIPVQGGIVNVPGAQAGTYTLNGGTLAAPATVLTGSYTQSGGASTFASLANTGTVGITGGSITVSSLSITGAGKMVIGDNVTAGTPLATSNVNLGSLSITGLGTLDIGNNHIIIDYTTGNDPIASVAAWIANGFSNGETPGIGPSIISSDIATADAASGFSYGIGYADGADGVIAGLPSGEIEIMFTLLGDANLDGTVNGEDFTPFSTNLGQTGSWDKGDFNYDGQINAEDFTPFSHDLSQSATLAAAFGPLESADSISLANVPEPASIGLLAAGTMGLLVRRRRQNR